jgi:8-amino-7-oxononanoate synthase
MSPVKSSPGSLEAALESKLLSRQQHGLFRQLSIASPSSVDFSSNDFLSLSTSPLLRSAFIAELQKHTEFPIGSGGSRLLDGNSEYAIELEREIAQFHGAEAALLWNSGFDANSGLFACIPQPEDVIVFDQLIHASVHDGMKLSRAAQRIPFQHNSVDDLKRIVLQLKAANERIRSGETSIFIAVESVYSMDGDIAPLAEIVVMIEEVLPKGNGRIVIDEAHGTGVLGPKGAGLVCELGMEKRVFARLHTFGKSLACGGGKLSETKDEADESSCGIMLAIGEKLSHQLRKTIDIHDISAISVIGSD